MQVTTIWVVDRRSVSTVESDEMTGARAMKRRDGRAEKRMDKGGNRRVGILVPVLLCERNALRHHAIDAGTTLAGLVRKRLGLSARISTR